jgi:hypothetical protein
MIIAHPTWKRIVFDHPRFHTRSQSYLRVIDECILHSSVKICTVFHLSCTYGTQKEWKVSPVSRISITMSAFIAVTTFMEEFGSRSYSYRLPRGSHLQHLSLMIFYAITSLASVSNLLLDKVIGDMKEKNEMDDAGIWP